MTPILYIAGPYSAGNGRTVAENIAIARAHAVAAAKRGWMPFAPHLNTAHFGDDCPEISNDEWIAGDLAILDLLRPGTDAVLMLPGWESSQGATEERRRALARGLEVFDPPASPECIPPATGRGDCQHYNRVMVGIGMFVDTCDSPNDHCPAWATCPIRGRCW